MKTTHNEDAEEEVLMREDKKKEKIGRLLCLNLN
jgi:hypothetical protein